MSILNQWNVVGAFFKDLYQANQTESVIRANPDRCKLRIANDTQSLVLFDKDNDEIVLRPLSGTHNHLVCFGSDYDAFDSQITDDGVDIVAYASAGNITIRAGIGTDPGEKGNLDLVSAVATRITGANVGIGGEPDESYLLKVNGALRLTNNILIDTLNSSVCFNTSNFGLFCGQYGDITLKSGGYENICLTSAHGYVGIGTTGPIYTLDVLGDVNIRNGYYLKYNGVDLNYSHVGADAAGAGTAAVNAAVSGEANKLAKFNGTHSIITSQIIDNGTYVGVGNANPAYMLDVGGNVNISTGSKYKINGTNLSAADVGAFPVTHGVSMGYIARATSTTAFGNSVIYDDGTNVGIGLTNPTTKLEIIGDAKIISADNTKNALGIRRGSQGADNNMTSAFGMPYVSVGGNEYKLGAVQTLSFGYTNGVTCPPCEIGLITTSISGYTQGEFILGLRNGTSNVPPTEVMRVTAAGRVGIGTNNPQTMMQINSPVGTGPLCLRANATNAQTPGLMYLENASGAVAWVATYASGALLFQGANGVAFTGGSSGTGNLGLYVNTAGNVGIGVVAGTNRITVSASDGTPSSLPSAAESLFMYNTGSQSTGLWNALQFGSYTGYGNVPPTAAIAAYYGERNVGQNDKCPTDLVMFTGDNSAAMAERMRILYNGNISIGGISSPSHKIEIRANDGTPSSLPSAAESIFITNLGSQSTGIWNAIKFGAYTGIGNVPPTAAIAAYYGAKTVGADDLCPTDLVMFTGNNSAAMAERMRILYNGNVGIGLTNPVCKLDISGALQVRTGANTNIELSAHPTSTSYNCIGLNGSTAEGVSIGFAAGATGDGALYFNSNSGAFRFRVGNGSNTYSEKLVILSGGNVGIGATNPASKLEVAGDTYIYTGALNQTLTVDNTYNGGGIGILGYAINSNVITTSIGMKGVCAKTYGTAYGVYGDGGTADFYSPHNTYANGSSSRWKSNIKTLEGSLNKILSLRGVSYDFDSAAYSAIMGHDAGDDRTGEIGIIAEELHSVIPALAEIDEIDKNYCTSVNMVRLIPVLIEAIKELNNKIKS
jgi:hypothetical protein